MMMSSYNKLLEIKKDCRLDYFVMACSYYFDIGYSGAKAITDDDIINAKANGIMTREFVQWIMRTAREIANVSESPIDLVQFCIAEDIYEITYYANKLPLCRLEDMLKERLSQERYNLTSKEGLDTLCYLYECEPSDFELLGYKVYEESEENG